MLVRCFAGCELSAVLQNAGLTIDEPVSRSTARAREARRLSAAERDRSLRSIARNARKKEPRSTGCGCGGKNLIAIYRH